MDYSEAVYANQQSPDIGGEGTHSVRDLKAFFPDHIEVMRWFSI